jgi:hypothetical protein
MRQQNDILGKKCKEEAEKKQKFERDFEKEQQRLKELERISEQQQKLLKKKTEDLLTAQRRLRSGSMNNLNLPIDGDTTNKNWPSDRHEMEKRENLLKENEKKLNHITINSNELEETYNSLLKQRKLIETKSNAPVDMRRLVEIDEALEALKTAIDYENDLQNNQKVFVKSDKNQIDLSSHVG